MYNQYKPARYIFRAFNLIVYAATVSVVFVTIMNEIYISVVMDSIFGNYFIDSKRALLLAAFLFANMFLILFFRLISKKEYDALLYYICDFIIRITFSIPVSFIIFYFVLYRFCGMWFRTIVSQAVVFILLFAIFDHLMRLQIRYQLNVSYFKVCDKV
ncbi:MAG: hypothetical protein HDR03_12010 [Lachnospiraceae bacterium]|nr:hypothetical protein [Lachnospiraceae bacterium]